MLDELRDTGRSKVEHPLQLGTIKGITLSSSLHLDELAITRHDHVAVGVGGNVLLILQVEQDLAIDNSDGDCGNGL